MKTRSGRNAESDPHQIAQQVSSSRPRPVWFLTVIGAVSGLLAAMLIVLNPSCQIPAWGAMREITFPIGIDLVFLPIGGALVAFIFDLWWHVVRKQHWYFKVVVVAGMVCGSTLGCLIGLNTCVDTAWLLEAGVGGLLVGMTLGGLLGFSLLCLEAIMFAGG